MDDVIEGSDDHPPDGCYQPHHDVDQEEQVGKQEQTASGTTQPIKHLVSSTLNGSMELRKYRGSGGMSPLKKIK